MLVKGAVAEGGRRQGVSLVMRNNIRLTVAFAESYRKQNKSIQNAYVLFLIF